MEAVFQTPWGEGKCRTASARTVQRAKPRRLHRLMCANGYPLDKVLDVLAKVRPGREAAHEKTDQDSLCLVD